MAIRTLEEIINSAIDFITSKRPGISTFIGSVNRDVVIESPAQEFDTLNQELSRTQKLQSVEFAEDQTEDELDAFAQNFGLIRLPGRVAAGNITFQIRNFSTSSSDVNIPVGTVVSTIGTDINPQVSFVTTQAVNFVAALAPSLFNPTSGLFEQISTISAQTVGESGNVAAGTITQLVTAVAGIDTIINTIATTSGTDVESNADFGDRIQIKLSGNNVGTPNGITSLLTENSNVIDSIVVTPNDPEMIRDEFGGEVDAYVIGEILTPISDVVLYQTAGPQEFILQHQPSISISSVTGIAAGSPFTFVQGVDFNFVLDPTTLLNGSVRLQNKVVFNIGGTNPDDASNVTINYVYNSLIEELQLEIDKDDGHIVTTDILVKEATEATIDIIADVTLFPGNVAADAITEIQTVVSTAINALGLGDDIDRSDIVGFIEGVESVDQVNLSTLVLSKNAVVLPASEQRLEIFKTEFPRAGNILINVV